MNRRYAALTLIALALLVASAAQAQTLVISPNPLNLFAQAGGTQVQANLNFTSSDLGATSIPFNVVPGQSWISVSAPPQGGWKTPATLTVTVTPSQLTPGLNIGSLSIFSTQFQTVPVNVTLSSVSVSPTSINLGNYQTGSTVYPASQTLSVSGANGSFTISKAPADTWYTAAAFGNPLSGVLVSFNQAAASSLAASSTPLQGTLTITPGGANPVPIAVPITLSVTASPQVTVNPTSLVFNWQALGTNNQNKQVLTLTSNSTQTVNFTASAPGVNWITLPNNPTSISPGSSTQINVQVDGSSQPIGTTNGTVQINLLGGALFPNGTTTLSVPVQLNVSNFPLLYASPAALTFSYQFGSNLIPGSQNVTPTSSGAPTQQMQYSVSVPKTDNWITAGPAGILATGGGVFNVSVNTAGLSPGTYTSSVIITPVANGSGQTPVTIPVTLTVVFTSVMQVSNSALVFPYQVGQAAPASQTVSISSSTGAPLSYVVAPPSSATAPWVQVSGSLTGITDQTSFTVSINPAGIPTPLQSGPLDATINVSATDPNTGATVNNVAIDVKLYASNTPQLIVTPSGPLALSTYPNSPTYPLSATSTVNLSSTSSLPGDSMNITGFSRKVDNGATIGNWLGGTNPGVTTPTSFTLNGTVFPATMPPGTYNGSFTVTATGPSSTPVADSPITIPVSFTVNSAKGIITTPQSDGSIQFTQTKGGQGPAAQTVQVATDGPTLAFNAVVNTGQLNWLTVGSPSGPTPGSFRVSADASNLTTGVYKGAVYVTIPNASGSPFRIPVTFTVTGGAIASSAQSLAFTQVVGGAAPAAQTVQITSSPNSVSYTTSVNVTTPANGNWLAANITAGSGATPGTVTVTVNSGSLAAGSYNGNVVITSAGTTGSPITIPVTLSVIQATLSAPTTALTFNQVAGGPAPQSQTVNVTATPAPIPFSVSTSTSNGVAWLTATAGASGTTGTTPGTVQISASAGTLAPGPYTGLVTITSAGAIGSPITIPVLLNVGTAAVLTVNQASLTFSTSVGQAITPQTLTLTSSASTSFAVATSTKDGANWLSAAPSSGNTGTTPVTITVSPSSQNLAVGTYTGTVSISSPNSIAPVTVNISLTVTAIPTPAITAVKNAASYVTGAVSPGENITIFGTGIGPAVLVGASLTANGQVSTQAGNTQVLFDGIPAPMIYASSTQTSVMVPYEIGGRATTNIQVVYSNVQSAPLSYNVVQAVPGIYTLNTQGFGPGVILNKDNITVNGPNTPAAKGDVVVVYMTGEGATSPSSTTGGIAAFGNNPLNKPILNVTATIGGQPATVQYAGSSPGIIYGVMQVNITVPTGIASGVQPIVINVGNNATQAGVTVNVQ